MLRSSHKNIDFYICYIFIWGIRVHYFRDSFSVLLRTQHSMLINDFWFRNHGLSQGHSSVT